MTTVFIVTKSDTNGEGQHRNIQMEAFSTREGADKCIADFWKEKERLNSIRVKFSNAYQAKCKSFKRNTGAYSVPSEVDRRFYSEAREESGYSDRIESELFHGFNDIDGPEECEVQQ